MKKYIRFWLWVLLLVAGLYLTYNFGNALLLKIAPELLNQTVRVMIYVFVVGFALSGVMFEFLLMNTSNSLNIYKRELEKESIDKTESTSKIKVLESKIEVLEKALEEALKKG